MAIQGINQTLSIQQNRDRRNDREVKFSATTAASYLGYTLSTVTGSTVFAALSPMLVLGGQTEIKNYSTGIEWYNLAVWTNQTTGLIGVRKYYSGTTSTWAVESLSTIATIPSSQWNYFRFPLGAGEFGDITISASSLATHNYHVVIQEANGAF